MWNSRPKFLIINALRNVVLSPNRFAQKSLIVASNGFASSQPRLFTSSQHRAPYNKSKQTNIAVEFVGDINRKKLIKFLDSFALKEEFRELCQQHNLNELFLHEVISSFRQYCLHTHNLPDELYLALSDLTKGKIDNQIVLRYFLKHAKTSFPYLFYQEQLKGISDLRDPANWYPRARLKQRKIIFHSGPTNSGKTYNAMQRFLNAESGVYCGPLKLLAHEVYQKSNALSTPCDLLSGEQRIYVNDDGSECSHLACTIEMAPLHRDFEVAIIDEAQFIRDTDRGRAWTRAILGICADEIHVCGEGAAADLFTRICESIGETVEVRTYDRLTPISQEETALESLDNVQPGDCIVCFRRRDIYYVSREIESRGEEVAVIYGALPPEVKLAQAAKFNDPNNACKIMVATDAIGTGLNLSIRRIIFYSMVKPMISDAGEKEVDILSASAALQISGRAGRYGSQFEHGFVTTYRKEDLPILSDLLSRQPEPILRAGLSPTISQIKQYASVLPNVSLSKLLDVFLSLTTINSDLYFVCDIEEIKSIADKIDHIPLELQDRYTFCCAPININLPFIQEMFLKFVTSYSEGKEIGSDWIETDCEHPFELPTTVEKLRFYENVFEVINCYLWLSKRFEESFSKAKEVREHQSKLNSVIQKGIHEIIKSRKYDVTVLEGSRWMFVHRKKSISKRLVEQGRLTPAMVKKIKREIAESTSNE